MTKIILRVGEDPELGIFPLTETIVVEPENGVALRSDGSIRRVDLKDYFDRFPQAVPGDPIEIGLIGWWDDKGQHHPASDQPVRDVSLTPVESSNIRAIGWEKPFGLVVSFLNGGLYYYPTANHSLFTDFLAAESLGKFFHAHIRALEYRKVS